MGFSARCLTLKKAEVTQRRVEKLKVSVDAIRTAVITAEGRFLHDFVTSPSP